MTRWEILKLIDYLSANSPYHEFLIIVINRHPQALKYLEGLSKDEILRRIDHDILDIYPTQLQR